MPYLNNDYKNFIRSARWQRLRAQYLAKHVLCERCLAKGKTTLATEVHHIIKCHDNPQLQMDTNNLEALCQPCHAPMQANDHRGYSREMNSDGYYVDPNHPSNKPRARYKTGTDATKLRANTGGRGKHTTRVANRPVGSLFSPLG